LDMAHRISLNFHREGKEGIAEKQYQNKSRNSQFVVFRTDLGN